MPIPPLAVVPTRATRAAGRLAAAALAVGASGAGARAATAQLPGVPAAPGAFVAPGLAVALNGGADRTGAGGLPVGGAAVGIRVRPAIGAAVGYAPSSGRFQLAGGLVAQRWGDGYRAPTLGYGARATVPVLTRGRLGVAAFAGAGGGRARFEDPPPTAPSLPPAGAQPDVPDGVSQQQYHVGASAGVRGALGGRAWALSLAPQAAIHRLAVGDDAVRRTLVRVGVAAEVAVTPRIGLAFAYEDGARAGAGEAGPRGGTFGAGLTYGLRGGAAAGARR